MKEKIVIIGGGPAGIAAALQLKRYNLDPLLIECDSFGGLLKNANFVENYPGFPNGIGGEQLTGLIHKQLQSFDIRTQKEKVETLDYDKSINAFIIKCFGEVFESESVIVASGTKPKKLNLIESLPEKLKVNIFYEIYPIIDCTDKNIVIIGGGDAAFDYALNLSKKNDVNILNRSDKISALPLLKARVDQSSKINYYADSKLSCIETADNSKLKLTIEQTGKHIAMECDYLVAAIGREANKDFYSHNMVEMENDLIKSGRLYLIGDVANGLYRQVSIAVGDGVKAAMQIYNNLRNKNA